MRIMPYSLSKFFRILQEFFNWKRDFKELLAKIFNG